MTKLRNAQAELKVPGLEGLEVELRTFGRRMLTGDPSNLRHKNDGLEKTTGYRCETLACVNRMYQDVLF